MWGIPIHFSHEGLCHLLLSQGKPPLTCAPWLVGLATTPSLFRRFIPPPFPLSSFASVAPLICGYFPFPCCREEMSSSRSSCVSVIALPVFLYGHAPKGVLFEVSLKIPCSCVCVWDRMLCAQITSLMWRSTCRMSLCLMFEDTTKLCLPINFRMLRPRMESSGPVFPLLAMCVSFKSVLPGGLQTDCAHDLPFFFLSPPSCAVPCCCLGCRGELFKSRKIDRNHKTNSFLVQGPPYIHHNASLKVCFCRTSPVLVPNAFQNKGLLVPMVCPLRFPLNDPSLCIDLLFFGVVTGPLPRRHQIPCL